MEEGAPGLPTSTSSPGVGGGSSYGDLQDGEFRPFIRRLPEFKFWLVRLLLYGGEKGRADLFWDEKGMRRQRLW